MIPTERLTWPETWMEFAKTIANRSYDKKIKVGAVIVTADNTSVLALGYNGNAHGFPNERDSLEIGKSGFIHAEQNAYYKLDYSNPSERIMYVIYSPCSVCAKGAIQCRMNRVVYKTPYHSDIAGIKIMRRGGIEVYDLEEASYLARDGAWAATGTRGKDLRTMLLHERRLKQQCAEKNPET